MKFFVAAQLFTAATAVTLLPDAAAASEIHINIPHVEVSVHGGRPRRVATQEGTVVVAPAVPAPPQVVYVPADEPPVVVEVAPPPLVVERQPAPPYAGAVWIPGHWRWQRDRHHWVAGFWTAPRPGHVWVAQRWVHRGNRWACEPGRWQAVSHREGRDWDRWERDHHRGRGHDHDRRHHGRRHHHRH